MVLQKAMKQGRNVHGIPPRDFLQHQGGVATLGRMPTPIFFTTVLASRIILEI